MIVGLTGIRVRLADVHGTGMLIDQVHLQAAEDFAVLGAGERAVLGSAALLDHLPEKPRRTGGRLMQSYGRLSMGRCTVG
ncbi:hypothetical protein [Streptomyces sp. NPDC047985]